MCGGGEGGSRFYKKVGEEEWTEAKICGISSKKASVSLHKLEYAYNNFSERSKSGLKSLDHFQ